MAALEAARYLAEVDHARAGNPIPHAEAEKIGAW
jgi:thioredoxin reductase (NADPH)